jgi:rod shape-determining protein MreC
VVERVASCFVYPFLRIEQYCVQPAKNYFHKRTQRHELQARCALLEKAVSNLEEQVIALRSSQLFAQDTKELVEYQKRFNPSYQHLVHIMLVQRTQGAHYMWVDAGSLHGVVPDMIAVHKNCLVGRVINTYPYYSKVQLISDASCNIAVRCQNGNALGIYQGTGDSNVGYINHVNHLHELVQSDLVFSSGQGLIFPQGFCIGTIESWEPVGVYYCVQVKLACNVDDINYCYLYNNGIKNSE